jgi:hypothetical protein
MAAGAPDISTAERPLLTSRPGFSRVAAAYRRLSIGRVLGFIDAERACG